LAGNIIAGDKCQNSCSDDSGHEDVIHIAIPRITISILLICVEDGSHTVPLFEGLQARSHANNHDVCSILRQCQKCDGRKYPLSWRDELRQNLSKYLSTGE
jgi:hypothetical protein